LDKDGHPTSEALELDLTATAVWKAGRQAAWPWLSEVARTGASTWRYEPMEREMEMPTEKEVREFIDRLLRALEKEGYFISKVRPDGQLLWRRTEKVCTQEAQEAILAKLRGH
jgi:hypothetical protein